MLPLGQVCLKQHRSQARTPGQVPVSLQTPPTCFLGSGTPCGAHVLVEGLAIPAHIPRSAGALFWSCSWCWRWWCCCGRDAKPGFAVGSRAVACVGVACVAAHVAVAVFAAFFLGTARPRIHPPSLTQVLVCVCVRVCESVCV